MLGCSGESSGSSTSKTTAASRCIYITPSLQQSTDICVHEISPWHRSNGACECFESSNAFNSQLAQILAIQVRGKHFMLAPDVCLWRVLTSLLFMIVFAIVCYILHCSVTWFPPARLTFSLFRFLLPRYLLQWSRNILLRSRGLSWYASSASISCFSLSLSAHFFQLFGF